MTIPNIFSISKQAAMAATLAKHGWDARTTMFVKAASATADARNAHRLTAAAAVVILESAGYEGSKQATVLRHLARADYDSSTDILMEPVYRVFALAGKSKSANVAETMAGAAGRVVAGGNNLLSGVMNGSNNAIAAALMLAMAGGSGIGALNWHLGRMSQEDDQDNAELAAQLRVNRVANRDLEQRLKSKAF